MASNLPKNLVFGSFGAAGLVAVLAILDLATTFPFAGSMVMDILFILSAAIVGYLAALELNTSAAGMIATMSMVGYLGSAGIVSARGALRRSASSSTQMIPAARSIGSSGCAR